MVVTPAHQFPTGIAYSARRRAELLDWARSVEGFVLEDDYDGDFRYDRAPVGALQGLDPERVVYTGSVSKSLAPGLRLGWLLVPEALAEEVVERSGRWTSAIRRWTSAIRRWTSAIRRWTSAIRRWTTHCSRGSWNAATTTGSCAAASGRTGSGGTRSWPRSGGHFPGARVTGIAAGLHVIAELAPRHGPQTEFLARAGAAGVRVRALTEYTHVRTGDTGPAEGGVRLVLGYAHLPPARIRDGVRVPARAVGAE